MHSTYSPGRAQSNYHLFLALQNFLSDKKLGSRDDCENRLLQFFANKDQDFYERGLLEQALWGGKGCQKDSDLHSTSGVATAVSMIWSPQATGAPTCATTLPLTELPYPKNDPKIFCYRAPSELATPVHSTHGPYRLRSALGGVVHESSLGNTPALLQSFELS
ncbi:hypothetical protein TNCV_3153591 [Trichonephila clavipes]|nr:hypothetical protein TNCV_3153591 [Trichonephila clavipes]